MYNLAKVESISRKIISINEQNSYTWHNLGTVLQAKGDYGHAKTV